MNSSDEWWSFGGVSLHQHGWSVGSLTGRLSTPPLRGEDQTAAYVPGELWMPKIPAGRTLVLPMWTTGVDPGTGEPVADARTRFNDNWAYLMQVFWNPDAEQTLTRRWMRTDPVTQQPVLVTADALAQLPVGEEIRAKMTGRTRAEFEVPLRLAHPFFYGPTVTTQLNPGGSAQTITNGGDWSAWSKYLYVDLVGPLTAPKVTNSTVNVICGLPGKVAAGETLTLDVRQFIALSSRSGSTAKINRSGEIYNSGTRAWMALARGANTLKLTATGTGYARIRFRPPYL